MECRKNYENFIKLFPQYANIKELEEAFLIDLKGYVGITIGYLEQIGIINNIQEIIDSGVLNYDKESVELINYGTNIKNKNRGR